MVAVPPRSQRESSHAFRPWMRAAFWLALSAQLLSVLVIAFGDIGFDHPGRYGLDFGDLLKLALLWFASSCVGFFVTWALREPRLKLVQSCVFASSVLAALIAVFLGGV